MSGIIDAVKKVAEREFAKMLTPELGVVTSVFPHSEESDNDNYECNVKLQYRDLELRRVPILTQQIGLSNPLHVGDLVLIMFIYGDVNAPVILGRLYNDQDRPPLSKQEEVIYKPAYSRNPDLKRLNIVLPGSDEENVDIKIHDNLMSTKIGKSVVTLKEPGVIELKTEPGKNSTVIMDDKGLRIITEGDIEIQSQGSITFRSEKDFSIKAQNIAVESQQSTKLKSGTTLDIKSGAPLNIQSDAVAVLKGKLVKIN
jgi:uncharacterized protein involved in type VI secretion and phage assembly